MENDRENNRLLPFGSVLTPAELADPTCREFYSWLRLVEHYVAECRQKRTAPRVEELAMQLGMTRGRLSGEFRRATGVTLVFALKQEQARLAGRMLIQTPLNHSRIAEVVGLGTEKSLRRVFSRVYGTTPGAFRELSTKCPFTPPPFHQ